VSLGIRTFCERVEEICNGFIIKYMTELELNIMELCSSFKLILEL